MIHALLFDLYGTLVRAQGRPFSRGFPAAVGVRPAAWMALLRNGLLTQSFDDADAFADHVARALVPDRIEEVAATCRALVAAECAGVTLVPGVLPLLSFLKRRGLKLALVSNLATPFKEPVDRLGLSEAFHATAYSCDEGLAKPDPAIYARVLSRLEVETGHALFVGDSLRNDIAAPAALGLRTAGVGVSGGDLVLESAAELGLVDLATLTRLLGAGDRLEVGEIRGTIQGLESASDAEQGRYNLVFKGTVETASGAAVVYVKRFLLPETAHLEAFAYQLQALTGLPACTAALHPGSESLLLMTEAPGRKWEQDLSEDTAYALGGHFVFALLFSNADIRPRNTFVDDGRVTVVDLEHCFFNLAIDTTDLATPERPETFDPYAGRSNWPTRTKKRVLSARATSRARRSFFGDTAKGSAVDEAFHAGFLDFYRRQQAQADAIADALLARIRRDPPLVIGTHGYRRALAEVDVADIRTRLAMDAQAAYEWAW